MSELFEHTKLWFTFHFGMRLGGSWSCGECARCIQHRKERKGK